jgi:DNA-binding LacI/PurR family transcriptional regulator
MAELENRKVKRSILYGTPIGSDEGGDSLVARIVSILENELGMGRWKAGDKLPPVSELARESGLNRGTLQYALEKMARKGLLRKERYQGFYVENGAALKRGNSHRIVSVWASRKIDEDAILHTWHSSLQFRWLRQEAERRGWQMTFQTFEESQIGDLETRFEEFAAGYDAVISVQSFRRHFRPELARWETPMVFWRDVFQMGESSPAICHDQPEGFAMMTNRLIELGHREIVFLPQSPAFEKIIYSIDQMDMQREGEARFRGHAEAMRAAGLTVNEDAARFVISDTESLRTFLERFGDATAIICGAGHVAWKIVLMAETLGISVPRQLSIMAPGPAWIQDHGPLKLISGVGFDSGYAARLCFEEIERQAVERTVRCSRHVLGPRLVEGSTVAPPRQEEREAVVAGGKRGRTR